jgi:hypothetical protein
MTSKVHQQAMARMAQDAWSMAVDRQRAAEAVAHEAWTMEAMAKAAAAKKQQQAAWKVWQAAERRAEEAQ